MTFLTSHWPSREMGSLVSLRVPSPRIVSSVRMSQPGTDSVPRPAVSQCLLVGLTAGRPVRRDVMTGMSASRRLLAAEDRNVEPCGIKSTSESLLSLLPERAEGMPRVQVNQMYQSRG